MSTVIQTGIVYGETLKYIGIGEYFKNCEIDSEEWYDIDLYEPKDPNDSSWMSTIRFRITLLSEEYYETDYNTSSAFAYELDNILDNIESDSE